MENHENLIGKVLGGRYKTESIVGEGGMSVVLRAYDSTENRTVTIKLLNLKSCDDKNAVERFTNEAKAVELLSHPNIVSVYDVSLDGDDKYIVMEYIEGITLKEYLEKKGRLEWKEAVYCVNQVLSALSHAHDKGIIHRDIKPENVMLTAHGVIKVIDFGIAKLPDSKSLTVIDKAIGTVNYISPEQASGRGSTEKSDIYSTGIMLYELVTGQLPFVSANSVSVAMMHVSSEPALPSSICESIPVGLEQIIIKSMMKEPDSRFGSAAAMRKALEYLVAHPETVFSSNAVDADGKPILSTGASQNNGNNTVITTAISPDAKSSMNGTDEDSGEDGEENENGYLANEHGDVKQSSMLPIVLGVTVAFFTAALLFMLFIWKAGDGENSGLPGLLNTGTHRDSAEDTLVVPQLVGTVYSDELYSELCSKGYNVTVKEVTNTEAEAGQITAQEPLADSTRKKNEKGVNLTLEVARGNSAIIFNDYRHYQAPNVKIGLEGLGLKVVIEKEYNDTVIVNNIIRTNPEAGASLIPGDTVTLFVSQGPRDLMVEIPGTVLGLTYNKAVRVLQELGITVDSERGSGYSDKYEENTVMGTEPRVGKKVSVTKDKVRLIISEGSEPAPEAVETVVIIPPVSETPAVPVTGTDNTGAADVNTSDTVPNTDTGAVGTVVDTPIPPVNAEAPTGDSIVTEAPVPAEPVQ